MKLVYGQPGVRNARKGMVDKASANPKAVSQANAGEKAKSGEASSRNPRKGTVDKPDAFDMGVYKKSAKSLEKVDGSGQPGSRNPRKGSVSRTPMFLG